MNYTTEIPLPNKNTKGNWFGHKVCYNCEQVYDARFSCCINCGSEVWDNLMSYENRDGKIFVNEKKIPAFSHIEGISYPNPEKENRREYG